MTKHVDSSHLILSVLVLAIAIGFTGFFVANSFEKSVVGRAAYLQEEYVQDAPFLAGEGISSEYEAAHLIDYANREFAYEREAGQLTEEERTEVFFGNSDYDGHNDPDDHFWKFSRRGHQGTLSLKWLDEHQHKVGPSKHWERNKHTIPTTNKWMEDKHWPSWTFKNHDTALTKRWEDGGHRDDFTFKGHSTKKSHYDEWPHKQVPYPWEPDGDLPNPRPDNVPPGLPEGQKPMNPLNPGWNQRPK